MFRIVGALQVLGGGTLLAAYALGGKHVDLPGASAVLTLLAIVQLGFGAFAVARAARLQRFVKQRPGTFVGLTLAPALVVVLFGGSNIDSLWVTAAQCWLIAAGTALPGCRLAVGGGLVIVASTAVWVAADGRAGGFRGDGDYLIAVIAMAKIVLVGLWYGQLIGTTTTVLARWHLIEVRELGIVEQLRAKLAEVDRRAAAVAAKLPGTTDAGEIAALRVRLERGVGMRDPDAPIRLGDVLDEVSGDHAAAGSAPALALDAEPSVLAHELSPLVADTLVEVLRRQLGNVVRHAPAATSATITAREAGGTVTLQLVDDGGGTVPARTGGGTAWTLRQLERIGGTGEYVQGPQGVGFELSVPLRGRQPLATVPELSVDRTLDRFAAGMVTAVRWSGYVGDSLIAQSHPELGARWLLMPAGALVIEAALRWGVPGLRLDRTARTVVASILSVGLVLVFTLPAESTGQLIPATTSVIVPAMLLFERARWQWAVIEAVRLAAVSPLFGRTGSDGLAVEVVYALLFSGIVILLRGFLDRALRLEASVLDAVGRTALGEATVRGLALHHDAVEVLLRSEARSPELDEAGADLEDAIRELEQLAAAAVDPRAVLREGLEASLSIPLEVTGDPAAAGRARTQAVGALDRLLLVEVAALAADERAAAAPPGLLGRRRLSSVVVDWGTDAGGRRTARLRSLPDLGGAGAEPAVLTTVASSIGIAVGGDGRERTLTF